MTLNGSESARYVARLKTLTAVGQLDPTRKTFLLRALFEANLIVQDAERSTIISLERADLSFIAFEDRQWKYLSLPESNLTGAKFVHAELSCANFQSAILHSADLSGILVTTPKGQCFPESRLGHRTNFFMADLSNARLTRAHLLPTNFNQAKFIRADLSFFYCIDCLFNAANFSQSDWTRAGIGRDSTLDSADLTETKLDSATFQMVKFYKTRLDRTSGTEMKCQSCLFNGSLFVQSRFVRSRFDESTFFNLIFDRTDFAGSTFINSTFSHLTLFQNNLNDVTFIRSILINVKFNGTRVFKRQFIDCVFENTFIPDGKR